MAWQRDQVPIHSPEYKHNSPNHCSNMRYHIFTEYETRDLKPVLYPSPIESRPHSPLVEEILSPKFDSEDSIRQRSCGINTRMRVSAAKLSPDRSTSMSGRVVNPNDCKAVSPIESIINTVNAAVSPIQIACPALRANSFKRILVSSSTKPAKNIEKPFIANNSSQWEWPSRLSQPIRPINTLRSRSQSRTRYSPPRTKSEAVRTTSSLRTATEPIRPIEMSEIPNVTIIPGPQRQKMDWDNYHRLDTINNFLEELESEFPALCTVGEIGKSLEGRPIKVLKISNSNANNPSVWVDAGIHAREWIGPAVNTFVANYIARNFNNLPPSVTEKDWYFLPVANPDGYEFTHTGDRMWRKNRAKSGGKYFGVDLNRNFSYNWGGNGSSDRITHCFYRGPAPFSEPESCAIRDMIQYSGARFLIYITLHSFGQVIIFPFASEDDLCPDYIRLLEGATVMSKAIFETNGNTYKVGLSKDVMYRASGTSNDWCYGTCGIPYCYLIELRSKKHRFMLPHEEIRESGVEILNCLLALVEFVDNRPLGEKYSNKFRGTNVLL